MIPFSHRWWIAAQQRSAVLRAIEQIAELEKGMANYVPTPTNFDIPAKLLNYFYFS
jgi:hypothetical protein